MVDIRIAVDGTGADVESLRDWLRREPELRGRIRLRSLPAPPGAMGSLTELVVEGIVTGTIGTLAGLLGQSLSIWLTRPRAHSDRRATVTVSGANGRSVSLTTENAADAERLLRATLDTAGSPLAPTQPAPPADGQGD